MAGGLSAVKAGAAGAGGRGPTVIVTGRLMASGLTPLAARMVKLKVPAVVGVPLSRPVVGCRANAVGRAQLYSVKLGVGFPVAVKVYGP